MLHPPSCLTSVVLHSFSALPSPLSPLPRYNAYSASYGDAMDTHSLTPAGVLSYFGSQMVGGKAGPDQTMNLPATAKVSYVSEL